MRWQFYGKSCAAQSYFDKYFLILYGWIAGAEKPILAIIALFKCPVSALNWLPNFPHKAWVDPGEGSFTCQVNRREWGLKYDHLCNFVVDMLLLITWKKWYPIQSVQLTVLKSFLIYFCEAKHVNNYFLVFKKLEKKFQN